MTRRWAPPTRYMLWRHTTSITKDFDLIFSLFKSNLEKMRNKTPAKNTTLHDLGALGNLDKLLRRRVKT